MAGRADEASCVRNFEQEGEGPSSDEQPLLVATVSFTEPLRKPFLQVGLLRARLYKAHLTFALFALFPQESHQYKYNLVNPPAEEAVCPVCLDVAIKPFLVECCGQHFCQQCLTSARARENVCPLCRENAPTAVHDKYFERNVIHKVQVKCNEKENGCQWEGLLGELEHHMTQCQYVKEDCPYKCGDRVQRRHLEEHKVNQCPERSYDCGHCEYRGIYREVIDQHWALCTSFPLTCPNNCGTENIPRGQLQVHCDIECPLQEMACDFSHAGCKVQVVRQELSQHMSDAAQQHMALMSRALLQDKEREIAQLKQQLRDKEQQHNEEMAKIVEEHKVAVEKKDQLHKEEREKYSKQHRQELVKKDEELEMKDKQHKEVIEKMSRLEGKCYTLNYDVLVEHKLTVLFITRVQSNLDNPNWLGPGKTVQIIKDSDNQGFG